MPAGHTHQPRQDRLPAPGYYEDPAYENHPAVAVSCEPTCAVPLSWGSELLVGAAPAVPAPELARIAALVGARVTEVTELPDGVR